MKVLLANCVYKFGSTGKIVNDIQSSLKCENIDVVITYGRSSKKNVHEDYVYKFCSELIAKLHSFFIRLGFVLPYGGNLLSTFRLLSIIRKESPDIVHLHCMNGSCVNIYKLLEYLGKHKIPTIVTHHAEFYYTGSCGHAYDCKRWFNAQCGDCPIKYEATQSYTFDRTHEAWIRMRRAFNYFDKDKLIFTAVSPWVKERSLLSPIVSQFPCEVVMNGIDTNIFKYSPNSNLICKRVHNCQKNVVIHSTAFFDSNDRNNLKGGYYVVEVAKRMPNITFVIVALNQHIDEQLPENVFVWGRTKSQQELAMLYSSADLTLITSKRETFSMVTVESLCCGTRVVGFEAGGPESIALPQYSYFVTYGNVEKLVSIIENIINVPYDVKRIEYDAKNIYDKTYMANRYNNIYKRILHNC